MTTRTRTRPLRVAVVQFAPAIGEVDLNVKKAQEICSKLRRDSVDLVCLPEMIFSGYDFPSADVIVPYLEEPQTGQTSVFCRSLASRLGCFVVAGYPERLSKEERSGSDIVGANSAIMYGPGGSFVGQYRKVNLFQTDKTWAKPGVAFKSFMLPDPIGTLTIGICMDLNPHSESWSIDGGPFELADYCLSSEGKSRTDVLVLLNAWLDSKDEPKERWDLQTLNYWLSRLRPLREKDTGASHLSIDDYSHECQVKDAISLSNGQDRYSQLEGTVVVICNRCGDDNGTLFAGTSVILRFGNDTRNPDIVGVMSRRDEDVRIWCLE